MRLLLFVLVLCLSQPVVAQPPSPGAEQLLHRLESFIHWPTEVRARGVTFVVGFAGSDPLERVVTQWNASHLMDGRPVLLRRVSSVEEMRQCHMLFLGRSMTRQVPAIVRALWDAPVLTVAAIPGFGHMGGMVELPDVPVSGRRFHLNPVAARRAGLGFHVGLLSVSTVLRVWRDAE